MHTSLKHIIALSAGHCQSTTAVALTPAGYFTWRDLSANIIAWQGAFEALGNDLTKVHLYHTDACTFVAALLACWRMGISAVLPPNNLPGTVAELKAISPFFAGDFPEVETIQPEAKSEANTEFKALDLQPQHIACLLFTSGSSGQAQCIPKTFAQLDNEIHTLEHTWGEQLNSAVITATVSHQHIYGLLFRLLWPLCCARVFVSVARKYWEEIVQDINQHAHIAIVSSPAHLHHVPELTELTNSQALAGVFSSGAPLHNTGAEHAAIQLQSPITEVYGSTETGGIAWKPHHQKFWQSFHGVQLKTTQHLVDGTPCFTLDVTSPHLPDQHCFATEDRVQMLDNQRFKLLGRMDRIAKISGKRISLTQLERALADHPWVTLARVFTHPIHNERLAAVIVLSEEAKLATQKQPKFRINQQLHQHLATHTEAVAIPRFWRYCAQLPCNSQGKTTLRDLQHMFMQDEAITQPEVLAHSKSVNTVQYQLYIPKTLHYFNGHFPEHPILPGVVQTHWAIEFGKKHWPIRGEFYELAALKFQHIISAEQMLELALQFNPDKNQLTFTYQSDRGVHSSGRVNFHKE